MIHNERALWLVFEHLDLDMKQFMDTHPQFREEHGLIKVRQLVRCTPVCSTSSCWVTMTYSCPYLRQMTHSPAWNSLREEDGLKGSTAG